MAKQKNVQIPLELFNNLLDMLDYIDITGYSLDFQDLYHNVLFELNDKKKRMETREAYTQMIVANQSEDEDAQLQTRIEYLKKKFG